MSPKLSNIKEEDGIIQFNLSGISLSLANALRRTIMSDLSSVFIDKITVQENNTSINDEILKSRLSYIPVHLPQSSSLDNFTIELDIDSFSETSIIITSEDLKIKDNRTNTYINSLEIFPPDEFGNFIEIVKLKPNNKQSIKIIAKLELTNSTNYSINPLASLIIFHAYIDEEKLKEIYSKYYELSTDISSEEIRRKLPYSSYQDIVSNTEFIFKIETVGYITNINIFLMGLDVLISKFESILGNFCIKSNENIFEILIGQETYTTGNILKEFLIKNKRSVIFHSLIINDTNNILRFGFEEHNKSFTREFVAETIKSIVELLINIKTLF